MQFLPEIKKKFLQMVFYQRPFDGIIETARSRSGLPELSEGTFHMPRRSEVAAENRLTGTQSIERALLLLREIAAHNRGGSRLLDLATRTGLQRPTVHRMLKCLASENMVQQDGDTHRYYLGSMVFELGLTATPRFNLREMCHPALARIAEATGDTVFLTQRSGLD